MLDQERPWLTGQNRKSAIGFANAIGALLSIRRDMPMQLMVTFLHVAEQEGLTVTALAVRCRTSTTMMSRHLQHLGPSNRHGRAGLGLVTLEQRPHGDRREYRAYLTERGITVARLMVAAVKHPHWRILRIPHASLGQLQD